MQTARRTAAVGYRQPGHFTAQAAAAEPGEPEGRGCHEQASCHTGLQAEDHPLQPLTGTYNMAANAIYVTGYHAVQTLHEHWLNDKYC